MHSSKIDNTIEGWIVKDLNIFLGKNSKITIRYSMELSASLNETTILLKTEASPIHREQKHKT